MSAGVVDTVSEGIGVAVITVGQLSAESPELAGIITNASNIAFVDAMTSVFYVGAGFVVAAVLFAITLVPSKMRSQQAVLEDVPADALEEAQPARLLICCCAASCGRVVGQGRCLCHPSPAPVSAGAD